MIKFHMGLNFSFFTHFNKAKTIDICYNYANFSKIFVFGHGKRGTGNQYAGLNSTGRTLKMGTVYFQSDSRFLR